MPCLLIAAAAAVACAALPAALAWGDSQLEPPALQYEDGGRRALNRHRRDLRFPEGAVFSMALCLSWAVAPDISSIWTETVAVELDYDLHKENETENSMENMDDNKEDDKKEAKDEDEGHDEAAAAGRWRSRRDVYQDIEDAIHLTGHDGRACVHRAICEAAEMRRDWLTEGSSGEGARRPGIVMHILDLIFRLPELSSSTDDPSWQGYWSASRHILANASRCAEAFAGCPFSLLDIAINGRPRQDIWA